MAGHSGSTTPAAGGNPGCRDLAAAILATHAQVPESEWNASEELLEAAKPTLIALHNSARDGEISGASEVLAGIARLLGRGPFPAVSLHASIRGSLLPARLRPDRPVGPPEEDVLLHALSYAARSGQPPWPHGEVDLARLTTVVPALVGAIRCRMVPLRAAALRYVLAQLPRAGADLQRVLWRRAVWLVDSRCDNALALLLALTSADDPLVASLSESRQTSSAPDDPIPFARSDWATWQNAQTPVRLSGRIHGLRVHRRLVFADLHWDGRVAQLALENPRASEMRVGDLVTVRGSSTVSRTGQPTVFVDEVEFHQPGVPPAQERDNVSQVLWPVRAHLTDSDFTEAITPVLSDGYFGGSAMPFATWAAAAGRRQYLRVTTELALLQAVAAGTSRCYEIGPSFRNEGLRGQAAKEFLMLEAYASDLDLDGMASYAISLVRAVTAYSAPERTVAFDDAFQELAGVHPKDTAGIRHLAENLVPATAARTSDPDVLARRLWRSSIRRRLPGLALVSTIPGGSSPLIAGRGRDAQRLWLYADGIEIAEISRNERNPTTLADQFRQQFAQDPHPVHRDYRAVISMFEGGVPPCVGLGLSVTRLAEIAHLHAHDIPEPSRRPHGISTSGH